MLFWVTKKSGCCFGQRGSCGVVFGNEEVVMLFCVTRKL